MCCVRFACSAAVTPVAGRPDDVNIVVQVRLGICNVYLLKITLRM